MEPLISITICFIEKELIYFNNLIKSIEAQTYHNIELIIINKTDSKIFDNYVASSKFFSRIKIINYKNYAGFAENYNLAINNTFGDYIFVLNPDTLLDKNCLMNLYNAAIIDNEIGCVSPKILRMKLNGEAYSPNIIDSAGMFITKNIRHFDRGANEIDNGQYNASCYVFGVTGAGAFFKKSCLKSVAINVNSVNKQYFDENFWSSREDADISWRMQLYNWKCYYTPDAIMYHVRTLVPGGRNKMSKIMNYHGVKNRYLLYINNLTFNIYLKYFFRIIIRDLLILAGVLLRERYSLKAYYYIIHNLKKLLEQRREIQSKGLKSENILKWFEIKQHNNN